VWDPCAEAEEVLAEYNIKTIAEPQSSCYDGVMLAVKHEKFVGMGKDSLNKFLKPDGIFYDIKEIF
jgi:UDP-N-acetyl-D-galactosamine dehydrogenase